MPIVSHTVISERDLGGGTRWLDVEYIDHTGRVYVERSRVGADFTNTAFIALRQAGLDDRLIVWEQRQIEQSMLGGGEPSLAGMEHTTQKDALRFILRAFMALGAHKAVKIAVWLQGNVTSTQIEAATSAAVKDKVIARSQRLVALEADLDADDADRIEVR